MQIVKVELVQEFYKIIIKLKGDDDLARLLIIFEVSKIILCVELFVNIYVCMLFF
jgi:hypothetical protein